MRGGKFHAGDGLDPFARVGETGVCRDGADNDGAGTLSCVGLLDQVFEGHTEIGAATGVEASGVSVAINRRDIVQIEKAANPLGIMPVEEELLNGVAVGMSADEALAAVAAELGAAMRFLGGGGRSNPLSPETAPA